MARLKAQLGVNQLALDESEALTVLDKREHKTSFVRYPRV
jgi:hypothetical protein